VAGLIAVPKRVRALDEVAGIQANFCRMPTCPKLWQAARPDQTRPSPYTPQRRMSSPRSGRALAPDTEKAFQAFSQQVFADGALPAKTKQLIAVAVAHVTQCPYCIRGHTKAALRHGGHAPGVDGGHLGLLPRCGREAPTRTPPSR